MPLQSATYTVVILFVYEYGDLSEQRLSYHQHSHCLIVTSLWPPCVADADIIFLSCDFFLSSIFFLFLA